ncbi:hypothetical protein QYF36_007221 [Acer negundo]|nr:hypothetical protein QYF36_007221 [Acer negundo]
MFLSNLDQKDKMERPPCDDKLNVKKGIWTAEEDAKILAYVSKHGAGNWTAVSKKAGLRRSGKCCGLRWTNYLRPDLKHDSFTPQEEEIIIRLHAASGGREHVFQNLGDLGRVADSDGLIRSGMTSENQPDD